jgi:hypothetical protein
MSFEHHRAEESVHWCTLLSDRPCLIPTASITTMLSKIVGYYQQWSKLIVGDRCDIVAEGQYRAVVSVLDRTTNKLLRDTALRYYGCNVYVLCAAATGWVLKLLQPAAVAVGTVFNDDSHHLDAAALAPTVQGATPYS